MAVSVVASVAAALTTNDPGVTFSSYTPLEDDVVVLFPSSTSVLGVVADASLPAGWVNPLGDGVEVLSDAHGLCCLYHLVTAAEEAAGTTTYTATNALDAAETGNVVACVVRGVDPANVIDAFNSAFNSGNGTTPHVLPSLTGADLLDDSLVISCVAKDSTGTYTKPGSHTEIVTSNTNQGKWLGSHDTLTTASTNVTAVNITPSAGDEYCSISLAFAVWSGDATAFPGAVAVTATREAPVGAAGGVLAEMVRTTTLLAPSGGAGGVPPAVDVVLNAIEVGPPVAGYVALYDASYAGSITESGGLVSQWNDLSASGWHLTSTGTRRPTTGTRSQNSLNVLDFDGSANDMVNASVSVAQPMTQFVVCIVDSSTDARSIIDGQSGGRASLNVGSASFNDNIYAGSVQVFSSAHSDDATAHQFSAVFNGASSQFWRDAASQATGNPGTWSLTQLNVMSNRIAGGSTYTDGALAEVIIYPSALGTTDRQAVEAYLKAKWGTP